MQKNNEITLDYNGAYRFMGPTTDTSSPGTLIVKEDGDVPLRQASVGIGMSGKGTFAVQAQPNLTERFTPHPTYWILFGEFQEGQVLDIETITNAAQIEFPYNVYNMTATLGQDNEWTIKPTM